MHHHANARLSVKLQTLAIRAHPLAPAGTSPRRRHSRYLCPICGKEMKRLRSLRGHLATRHNMQKDFACPICGREYGYKHKLAEHLKTCHQGSEFPAEPRQLLRTDDSERQFCPKLDTEPDEEHGLGSRVLMQYWRRHHTAVLRDWISCLGC